MEFIEQSIPGVYVIEPKKFGDARGYFMETFRQDLFEQHVGKVDFVQDNESRSTYGVLRGIHFQNAPMAQAKLVRVIEGCVLDVAVDLRKSSPTFGKYVAVELSSENARQLFIPRGFAHGFLVLSPTPTFVYKVDNVYAPQSEASLIFNDSQVGIQWPIAEEQMLLSPKDRAGKPLSEVYCFD